MTKLKLTKKKDTPIACVGFLRRPNSHGKKRRHEVRINWGICVIYENVNYNNSSSGNVLKNKNELTKIADWTTLQGDIIKMLI